jgi:uncharacterized membrane protein
MANWPWAGILFGAFMVAMMVVFADDALARSGGSGGGGGFRGGGGGFRGGGGGFGGGGGLFFCGYMSPQTIMVLFFVMAVAALVQWALKRAKDKARVYRLRFGIGTPGERPWEELEAIVRRSSFDSPDQLAAYVRNVALYLRRKSNKITQASILSSGKIEPGRAEQTFQSLTTEARASFEREVLRYDGPTKAIENKREAKLEDELTDEDGDFGINEFFVVTLVVGVDNNVPELPERIASPEDLRFALERLGGMSAPWVLAAEVIWTPAAESDILPAEETMMTFPDLMELM